MAYANLVNQNCVGFTEEAFQRIRDFICKRNGTYDYSATGIGWTLHDSYYATDEDNCAIGDWFVIKSVGESGDEDIYYRIKWHEANHMNIQGMLYWNAATDTGYKKYPASDTYDVFMCDDDLAFPIWIYGDLDQIITITKPTTSYYATVFGCTRDLPYDTTVATCTGALNSGNDISIVVDIALPSEWAVDRYLFIRDTVNIDRIKIKTLNAGTKTITADLTHSFLAGNKLCADLSYHCNMNYQLNSTGYCLINHGGLTCQNVAKTISGMYAYCNPDDMNAEPIGESITVGYSGVGYMGRLKNIYKIANAIPGISSEDVYTDFDSVDWRVINTANNWWAMIKEV